MTNSSPIGASSSRNSLSNASRGILPAKRNARALPSGPSDLSTHSPRKAGRLAGHSLEPAEESALTDLQRKMDLININQESAVSRQEPLQVASFESLHTQFTVFREEVEACYDSKKNAFYNMDQLRTKLDKLGNELKIEEGKKFDFSKQRQQQQTTLDALKAEFESLSGPKENKLDFLKDLRKIQRKLNNLAGVMDVAYSPENSEMFISDKKELEALEDKVDAIIEEVGRNFSKKQKDLIEDYVVAELEDENCLKRIEFKTIKEWKDALTVIRENLLEILCKEALISAKVNSAIVKAGQKSAV